MTGRTSTVRLRGTVSPPTTPQKSPVGATYGAFREWTLRQDIRTLAVIPLEIPLVENSPTPVYRRIGEEALQLHELGWSTRKVAARFRVDQKTATRALAWAAAQLGRPAPTGYTPGSTKYQQIAKRAAELEAQGNTKRSIASQLDTTEHTVRRSIAWYRRNGGAQ